MNFNHNVPLIFSKLWFLHLLHFRQNQINYHVVFDPVKSVRCLRIENCGCVSETHWGHEYFTAFLVIVSYSYALSVQVPTAYGRCVYKDIESA
jgi:hypothetical protein